MGTITDFEQLEIWKLARLLYKDTHTTLKEKNSDDFLIGHIKRTAVSISSNIAEGFERKSTVEFLRFLRISLGSCAEYRAQVYLLLDSEVINQKEFDTLYIKAKEVGGRISKMIVYLRRYKTAQQQNQVSTA